MQNFWFVFKKLMAVIPAILIMTIANIFICFLLAVSLLNVLIANGINQYLSLTLAILCAIITHFYIAFNHKIRQFINDNSNVTEISKDE